MTSWRQRLRDRDKIIELQQKQIDELQERIKELERFLKSFDNPHTPPSKKRKKNKENKEDNNKPRFPGKPKGSNGGGINIPEPDKVEEHKLDICPITNKPLGDPIGYRTKRIIDFPDKPILVIEHRIYQYLSPSGHIVEKDVKLPKGIYGGNIQSITVMLKNLTNSHDKIANFMRELGAPSFSSATVQNIAANFINVLEPVRNQTLKDMRNEKYLHADETGFNEDGKRGYVWGLFSKVAGTFLAARDRSRTNIIKLLRNFKGVLITDGYGAYDFYPLRQRCWAHLIREFKNYTKNNEEIGVQYTKLKRLYEFLKMLNVGPPDEKEIAEAKWMLDDIVTCLKAITGARGLVTLIENGGDDWFTALYHEGVPLDNNHAEREIRPLVLLRKSIGCYRNWKGKRWIDIVLSVLHTWRLQELNVFKQLRAVAY